MRNKKEKLLLVLLTIFSPLIHEIGHLIGYKIDRIPAKLSFFMIEPLNVGRDSFWGTLGGILIQILLIVLFLLIAFISNCKKEFWLIMCLPLTLSRIIPDIFFGITSFIYNRNIFLYNDEGYIARLFNISLVTSYIFFAIIFILFWIILRFNLDKNYFYKLNLKISLGITLLGIIAINI